MTEKINYLDYKRNLQKNRFNYSEQKVLIFQS